MLDVALDEGVSTWIFSSDVDTWTSVLGLPLSFDSRLFMKNPSRSQITINAVRAKSTENPRAEKLISMKTFP
jgi:hypothetical protein